MTGERLLNVSALEPCEPMERILKAIDELRAGEYLHVLHRMEPVPLYSILKERGYDWLLQPGKTVPVELYVWRSSDVEAKAAIKNS